MLLASLLFACMGVCVKLGGTAYGVGEMVFWRGAVGLAATVLIAWTRGVALATPHWRLQLARGLSGSVALVCYFWAINLLPLATAVTLSYTSPLFVALILAWHFGERAGHRLYLALVLGLAGIALLLRPTLGSDQWLGALVGLATGMIASLAYISVRELGRAGEPEVRTVFWFSLMTTVTGTGLSTLPTPLTGVPPGADDASASFALMIGIGLFGTGAQLAMTRAYRHGRTLLSASLSYTTVIFSSLFGHWLWSETLSASALIAMLMIIASGVMVGWFGRKQGPPAARG